MAIKKDITTISISKRKLVKSSAAAIPAILTLRSGAAFARSSADACIERDQDRAAVEKPKWAVTGEVLDDSDPWVRVESEYVLIQEAKVEKTIANNVKKKRLVTTGYAFQIVLTSSGWKNIEPFSVSGQYYTFIPERWGDPLEEVIVMKSDSLELPKLFKVVEGNPFNEGNNNRVMVLAQVNGNGVRIGYGPSPEGNNITGSCWASVNPGGVY